MMDEQYSENEKKIFQRSRLLLGNNMMTRMANTRVIVFGVGGVGSWCVESLVRSGIHHITIVDSDTVCETNCNRQLMATSKTIGEVKVEALCKRLLEINQDAEITTLQKVYTEETKEEFHIDEYDYVIDAIDSLKDKISLILHTTSLERPTIFSSMGAALRINPTMVHVAEFWKVRNDTLGAALRKRMKRAKTIPAKKFLCVYSEELPMENNGVDDVDAESCTYKAQINGSLSHITGIFGFTLAGLVMQDIQKKAENME